MSNSGPAGNALTARDVLPVLDGYRAPSLSRSTVEILVTLVPLVLLWLGSWYAQGWSLLASLGLAAVASGFLVRLFLIQHDCGHGSFFRRRRTNDWTGRAISVLTLTPYDTWRRSHATHHASSGNLDRRGIGDINTLTVAEYLALPRWRRLVYRLYRHPFVMFGLGPTYLFLLRNRLPDVLPPTEWRAWISPMATNLAVVLVAMAVIWLVGLVPFLLVHLPIVVIAASIGVWLFYVQHQFEETSWDRERDWSVHEAALHGSSHYDLPLVLRWLTANIGIHHVHHLCSRIPYYRLSRVLADHPELKSLGRITIPQSIRSVRLTLWDESRRQLISFRELKALARSGGA